MNKQEINEKLKENGTWCTECNTGEIDRYVKIMKAMELVGQLAEPQKPVVPGFVAELLDYYRQSPDVDLLALLITFKDWYYSTAKDGDHEEAIDWLVKHPEIYMRAWLFGYEVEKEPLYTVEMPSITSSKLVYDEDYCKYRIVGEYTVGCLRQHLTEKEIKAFDERYWAFAVPVERV